MRFRQTLTAIFAIVAAPACVMQNLGVIEKTDLAATLPPIEFPPAGIRALTVNWDPNPETSVNQSGGGYRIYYSADSRFPDAQTRTLDVPYVSGSYAPTQAQLTQLSTGLYYVRIVARANGVESDRSVMRQIQVP